VESGLVVAPDDGSVDVVIDVPSGRVTARVHREQRRVRAVDFVNVPSWVVARDVSVATSRGVVRVTVAFGGAIYATVRAEDLGIEVAPEHLGELIRLGREIKWTLDGSEHAIHPSDPRLNGVYGTILFDELGDLDGIVRQRNVTVFADGEVDRSPCGSGTSARLAVLAAEGRLPAGSVLHHESIVGSSFTGRVIDALESGGRAAVVTQVSGSAYRTGEHVFSIDPRDPLVPGFVLR
jgi:proline racemase